MLLLDLVIGITGSAAAGLIAALGYALATPVWGWSTTMLGHAPVAALLLIALWAIWRGSSGERELARLRYPLIAGGALGLAGLIELQAALPALIVLIWMVWRTRDLAPRLRLFVTGALAGLVALLPMALYNLFAFGMLFRVGYQGVVGFSGMEQGFFGLGWPRFDVAIALLAGMRRGLVWVAPVLLLAPLGIARLIARRETRDLGWLAAALALVMLLYNASYVYWDGGDSTGPRHLVPALGFLALGLAPLWQSRWRWPLVALLALSMALNGVIAATTITARDIYPVPLTDQIFPALLAGKVRTIANQFWGWPGWAGMAFYLAFAVPLLGWLAYRAKESDHG
jgi:4-amino-4-deoxy-L-arabinose transferase-like glycosyltransferase